MQFGGDDRSRAQSRHGAAAASVWSGAAHSRNPGRTERTLRPLGSRPSPALPHPAATPREPIGAYALVCPRKVLPAPTAASRPSPAPLRLPPTPAVYSAPARELLLFFLAAGIHVVGRRDLEPLEAAVGQRREG